MKQVQRPLAIAATLAVLLSGCGKNPFGNNAPGGLQLFASIGKAIGKPSAVHEEENNKNATKNSLSRARATLKRAYSTETVPAWRDTSWVERIGVSDTFKYVESVVNKPADDDPDKKVTGIGSIKFFYNGDATQGVVDVNKITNILAWQFDGRELKTWNNEVCSMRVRIDFSNSTLNNIKPGLTQAWGRNISGDLSKGHGDTAYLYADSLDESGDNGRGVQFGGGVFHDAHTGKDNTGRSTDFSFTLQVLHKGTYTDYKDNEGIMTFKYPWGETGDSLFFKVRFCSMTERPYDREGEIRKNGPDGALLVTFTSNDKYGTESVVYYDEKGEVVN